MLDVLIVIVVAICNHEVVWKTIVVSLLLGTM